MSESEWEREEEEMSERECVWERVNESKYVCEEWTNERRFVKDYMSGIFLKVFGKKERKKERKKETYKSE